MAFFSDDGVMTTAVHNVDVFRRVIIRIIIVMPDQHRVSPVIELLGIDRLSTVGTSHAELANEELQELIPPSEPHRHRSASIQRLCHYRTSKSERDLYSQRGRVSDCF
jgi:hypothetical protein